MRPLKVWGGSTETTGIVRRIFGTAEKGASAPTPLRRSGSLAVGKISVNRVPVEEVEADSTDKWTAVPEEIGGEKTPAPSPVPSPNRRQSERHRCRTLASPIPAILAETMELAREDEVVIKPSTARPIKLPPPRR